MSDTLSCSKCKSILPLSSFTEDELKKDDSSRICLMCNIQTRDDKAKQIENFAQSETKMTEETSPTITDTPQESQQVEERTEDPTEPRVFIATHMYVHPEVKKWIPCVVEYNMQSGAKVITLNLGSDVRQEIVITKDEVEKRFDDYDEDYAYKDYTEEQEQNPDDNRNHNNQHQNQNPDPTSQQPTTTTTTTPTVAIGSDFPSTEDVDMAEGNINTQSNSNSHNTVTLDKFVEIFKQVEAASKKVKGGLTDKVITQLATIEYEQHLRSKAVCEPPKTTDENKNFAELLYQETRLSDFKHKFPRTRVGYWGYSFAIEQYRNEHVSVPETRILEQVVNTCSNPIRTAWNTWKEDQAQKLANAADHTGDKELDPNSLRQSLCTINNFESFMIHRLRIQPDIIFFNKTLENIQCGRDENPTETHERLQRYLREIKVVKQKLNNNEHVQCNIRKYSDENILELYQRVFIFDNNSAEYNNDGILNGKVKIKLSQYVQNNFGTITLDNFIQYIRKLHTAILPSDCVEVNVEGKYWKRFKYNHSVFQLPTPSNQRSSKRKNEPTTTGTPRKRFKNNDVKPQTCRGGSSCSWFIKSGRCRFYHTSKEMRMMNKLRKEMTSGVKEKAQTWPWSKGKDEKGSGKNPQQATPRKRCRYGNNCWKLQRGGCMYEHPKEEVKCGYCDAIGHIQFECRKFKKDKAMTRDTPRYNPVANPNAKPPNPHALTIQYVDGEPYQLTTTWTALKSQSGKGSKTKPVESKKKKLLELKSMQREISRQINAVVKQSQGVVDDDQYESVLQAVDKARQRK